MPAQLVFIGIMINGCMQRRAIRLAFDLANKHPLMLWFEKRCHHKSSIFYQRKLSVLIDYCLAHINYAILFLMYFTKG